MGVAGNKRADETANEASRSGLKLRFKIPHTDLFAGAIAAKDKLFRNYLENAAMCKGRTFAAFYQKYAKKPWFYKKNLSKEQIVTVNSIRSNHYNLSESLYR